MGRWCTLDDLRCAAFIFLLGFKPSEPYLTDYLKDSVGLTKDEINNEVYPVNSYASVVVATILALSKVLGHSASCVSDKSILIFGAMCRMCTRFLLLFAKTVPLMQLMQVSYAVGSCSKLVFYAYCLRISPSHPQRTVALCLAAELFADTTASLLGDVLLGFGFTYRLLMIISAASVASAVCVSCTFRSVDLRRDAQQLNAPSVKSNVQDTLLKVAAVYRTNYFGLITLWSIWSVAAYDTIYGYESSFYSETLTNAKSVNVNGTVLALAVFGAAFSALLLTSNRILYVVSPPTSARRPLFLLVLLSIVGAACVMIFTQIIHIATLMPLFALYMMCHSFGAALAYGECCRAVCRANTHHTRARAPFPSTELTYECPASGRSTPVHGPHNDEHHAGTDTIDTTTKTPYLPSEHDIAQGVGIQVNTEACSSSSALISVVVVVNSWLATSVQTILIVVLFQWLEMSVTEAFRVVALITFGCMCVLCIAALMLWVVEHGREPSLEKVDAPSDLNREREVWDAPLSA